jgi:hypothetical protein
MLERLCAFILLPASPNRLIDRQKMSVQQVASTLTFGTGVLHLIQINHQPDATIFLF